MDRRAIRLVGAAAAATMAAIYYLIGLGILDVVEPSSAARQDTNLLVFGGGAGTIFLVGAILLVVMDHRPLWIAGAVLQVLVAAMYVAVSRSRTPPFELWGVALRVIQVPLLGALLYLAWRMPARADRRPPALAMKWLRR